jgi:hypothetical protein
MKQLLLLLLFAGAARPAAAQQPACKTVHMGTFQMTGSDGTTTRITRKGNQQTELVSNSNQQTDYTVKWLDDCTYVLIPGASVFAKYPETPPNARLTVRIVSVGKKGYSIEATSNFSEAVMRGEVTRVQ